MLACIPIGKLLLYCASPACTSIIPIEISFNNIDNVPLLILRRDWSTTFISNTNGDPIYATIGETFGLKMTSSMPTFICLFNNDSL